VVESLVENQNAVERLQTVRARIEELKTQRRGLESRSADFQTAQRHGEDQISKLRGSRDEALRVGDDERVLVKIRKGILDAQAGAEEADAGVKIMENELSAVDRELAELRKEEVTGTRGVWRQAANTLVAKHKSEVSDILIKLWVCLVNANPTGYPVMFPEVLAALDPQLPRQDIPQGVQAFQMVKAELEREFFGG
jgi:chromosome segregation ATPase